MRTGQVRTGQVRTGQVRAGQVMTGPKIFLELKSFWTQNALENGVWLWRWPNLFCLYVCNNLYFKTFWTNKPQFEDHKPIKHGSSSNWVPVFAIYLFIYPLLEPHKTYHLGLWVPWKSRSYNCSFVQYNVVIKCSSKNERKWAGQRLCYASAMI